MSEIIPLKVLDDILKFLFKSDDHKALKIEVKNFVELNNFIFKQKSNITLEEISKAEFNKRDSLILFNQRTEEAIFYLSKNNFIRLNGNELSLTYDGLIQYSKSFVATYNSEQYNKNRLNAFETLSRKVCKLKS
ncbi:hypothetical protein [Flavobacterium psychrophilum]|uniref:hypothetical protein n=1 Tax=Flavobacterium psychrophilum TaxID=96345 RepID=UPI000B7C5404|nr:hypothetical protein [Flavobacterium psychrophilum]SNB03186.1 hypothetical protein FPC831_2160001 [Flavobacterium psychrophilum]